MTGSTIAAMFADAGVRVALVEAALIGRGSTVASTALLVREPEWRTACETYLAVEFGRRSRFRPYGPPPDVDCGLTAQDAVYYAARTDAVQALKAEYRRRRTAGFAGDWLTPGALRRLKAISGSGAIRTRHSAQIRPFTRRVSAWSDQQWPRGPGSSSVLR